MRSFRAEQVSDWVKYVLDHELAPARTQRRAKDCQRLVCDRRRPPDVAQFGRSLLEDPNRAKHKLSERPQTILHGDVHVENIFFDDTVEPARVTLFDWEDVTIGNGLSDVAWLVTTSVGTGDVEWEAELVRHYYEALLAAGIEDYSWGECQADYRLAIENVFVQGVLNSCVERGESAEEIAAEHELGQRYMLAAHRGRIWEIRDSKGVAGQTAT